MPFNLEKRMSDLQFWLLVIGALIVAAVLVFNWMQERRFRKQADAAFQPMADALKQPGMQRQEMHDRVEPELREPVFDAGRLSEVDEINEPHSRIERGLQPTTVTTATPYDELIEYRVRLGCDGAPANLFSEAINRSRTLGKPVLWFGQPAGATEWEEIRPWLDTAYQQVMATMQLADRNGAALEEQLAALCELAQSTARTHQLRVACDDLIEAVERAQAIDRFCGDIDVLIGLNVAAPGEGMLNLARIVNEAEANGMVLDAEGAFQLLDSRGEMLYSLCNHDAEPFDAEGGAGRNSQGVTLQFDVPRVPDGLNVFDGMVAFGRRLASEAGGILVDDNLRPLTDSGIEKIRSQLAQIYERMEARGVPSGSRRAMRLFS
jgi:FtsZ-interacting cell division protein ZipA